MLFFLLYKIGEAVALVCPIQMSYRIAVLISDIKYFFSFRERREIVENLKLVLPDATAATLKKYSKEIFANFSKYLVDFLRFKKVDLEYVKKHVEIIGREYIDTALEKGKGAVILSAHLGSWELGGATMGLLGYNMNAVVLEHKNKLVNRFFVNQRRIKNETAISINFALRKCFSALAANGLLAIVGDKDFTNNGAVVKFFGKNTLLPKGPAVLNIRTGAVIVPGATVRVSGDYFKLIFCNPIEYSPSGDFDQDVAGLTEKCTAALEGYIRRYPTQWYCFRRFWQ